MGDGGQGGGEDHKIGEMDMKCSNLYHKGLDKGM